MSKIDQGIWDLVRKNGFRLDWLLRIGEDYRTAAWTITAGAATYETDPALSVALTTDVITEILCVGMLRWTSDTVRVNSIIARAWMDGATAGATTGWISCGRANDYYQLTYATMYNAVAAGAHTFTFQAARNNAGDTVTLRDATGGIVSVVSWSGSTSGISLNRGVDGDADALLVDHDTVSGATGSSSPGTQVDGAAW